MPMGMFWELDPGAALFGAISYFLLLFCIVWCYLALFGISWYLYPVSFGTAWHYVVLFGSVWYHFSLRGITWRYLVSLVFIRLLSWPRSSAKYLVSLPQNPKDLLHPKFKTAKKYQFLFGNKICQVTRDARGRPPPSPPHLSRGAHKEDVGSRLKADTTLKCRSRRGRAWRNLRHILKCP